MDVTLEGYYYSSYTHGSLNKHYYRDTTLTVLLKKTQYRIDDHTDDWKICRTTIEFPSGEYAGSGRYDFDTELVLKAELQNNYNTTHNFIGWYDGSTLVSSDATYNYTIPSRDVEIEAVFAPKEHITIITKLVRAEVYNTNHFYDGAYQNIITGGGAYESGKQVRLYAGYGTTEWEYAEDHLEGYRVEWWCDGVNVSDTREYIIPNATENKTCEAHYYANMMPFKVVAGKSFGWGDPLPDDNKQWGEVWIIDDEKGTVTTPVKEGVFPYGSEVKLRAIPNVAEHYEIAPGGTNSDGNSFPIREPFEFWTQTSRAGKDKYVSGIVTDHNDKSVEKVVFKRRLFNSAFDYQSDEVESISEWDPQSVPYGQPFTIKVKLKPNVRFRFYRDADTYKILSENIDYTFNIYKDMDIIVVTQKIF